jgi:glycosyltransferase involved in cell wall biosynthesis
MRIGIDLHMVNDFMQGSRTYTYNLTQALLEIDPANDYYLYFKDKPNGLSKAFKQPNVHIRRIVPTQRIIRLPISFPLKLYIDQIDVFHCQYMAPPICPTPYVVTLHDILHETNREYYPKALGLFMRCFYPFCARKAAHVFTVSEYSKKQIIKRYRVPEERMTITYNAVSDEFHKINDRERILITCRKYKIHENYILFVGRLEPRKNIIGLIKAYHIIKQRNAASQKLVIAGMKDFMYKQIFNLVEKLKMTKEVIFTGRVDQGDLPLIYNGADLFVYPSFAEGFGLPPLEAMACGVPVVTSNTTSLPEVVGDAGIMIDPHDTHAIAHAMQSVLNNPELRTTLIRKGLARSRRFSWQKVAEKTLRVYKEIFTKRKV